MSDCARSRTALIVIASLFAILGAVYSIVTPLFEASDEISHYPVVQHIATTGTLPVQRPGLETLWEQEGSQPPLYYMISAALTFWIDTSDLEQVRWRNPHAKLGIPLDPDNRNMVIHTEAEAWPWHGTVLAVHLIRLFSVGLGTVTVVLTYLIAREAVLDRTWVPPLAAAITAFNPMFLFITGSVNNDNLTVMLSSWVILLCARILRSGLSKRRVIILTVVAALATITKISGLTLLPIIGFTLLAHARRTGQWRQVIYAGLTLTAVWLIFASWWYARNLLLYGELLGLKTHVAIAGGRQIDLMTLITREDYGFWVSYWALFGAVNILADRAVYTFYAVLSLASVAGLGVWLIQRVRSRDWDELWVPGLLITQVVIVLVGVIRWTMMTYASQGRLVFPAIAALSTLMALGLLSLSLPKWHTAFAGIVGVPLFLIAAISPFRYIAPTYVPPPIVNDIPADAARINAVFEGLELVAARAESVTVEEGGRIPLTLYWRAAEPLDNNYSLYLHALGRDYTEIGKIDSYPGAGSLPTTRMEPGVIYADYYWLELDQEFQAPTALRVLVGVALHQENSYIILNPILDNGIEIPNVILDAGVAYPNSMVDCRAFVEPGSTPDATFGGFAALWVSPADEVVRPGDEVEIPLIWDRIGETSSDWTVFVHLVDATGQPIAQADSPPLHGFYPTSLWTRPCQVKDIHKLVAPADAPPGHYQVLVGLYDPNDPGYVRAPASDPDNTPYPNNAVPVGTVTIEGR